MANIEEEFGFGNVEETAIVISAEESTAAADHNDDEAFAYFGMPALLRVR